MDRFEAMAVMMAAVECGSVSKASRKLGVPLATVSRKVSELESHLKADLLIRSAKGLDLTPAGHSYITAAKVILEQLDEAERTVAGEYTEPKGDLVVTAPTMFGRLHLLPVVMLFLDAFPDVSAELMLTDRVAHFLDDQVDVALRIGDLPDSSLIATRLGAVRRVICASPGYLAKRPTPAIPQDVASHDAISFGDVSAQGTWAFWSAGAEIVVPFESRLSVSTIEAGIAAGLAGAGLLRAMSYQVADFVREGRLQLLLEPFEPPPRPVHLVYDRRNRLPLKLRTFVDFVVPRLRELRSPSRTLFTQEALSRDRGSSLDRKERGGFGWRGGDEGRFEAEKSTRQGVAGNPNQTTPMPDAAVVTRRGARNCIVLLFEARADDGRHQPLLTQARASRHLTIGR